MGPIAAVLVGGQSRRFGSNKAAHVLDDRTFARWVLDAVEGADLSAVVVGGAPDASTHDKHDHIPDDPTASGPMAGLYAALRFARAQGRPGAILLACDQPGISVEVIRSLVERAAPTPDAPLAFSGPTGIEPFPAYYPVKLLDGGADEVSMRGLLESARPATRVISGTERAEFGEATFANINTPEELDRFLTLRRS